MFVTGPYLPDHGRDTVAVRFNKGLFPRKEPSVSMKWALLWIIVLLVFVLFMMRYIAGIIKRLGG